MKRLSGLIAITFIGSLLSLHAAWASCGPSSCSASCGGTCTYFRCTGTDTRAITIDRLPFTYEWAPNACSDSIPNGTQITNIPADFAGQHLDSFSVSINHSYGSCVPQTFTAPPCINFSLSGNSSSLNISLSVTGGSASRGTQSYSGSCAYGGQTMDWGWPSGKTSDSYSGPSSPGPERSGCSATYCVWANGPGGEAGPACQTAQY